MKYDLEDILIRLFLWPLFLSSKVKNDRVRGWLFTPSLALCMPAIALFMIVLFICLLAGTGRAKGVV